MHKVSIFLGLENNGDVGFLVWEAAVRRAHLGDDGMRRLTKEKITARRKTLEFLEQRAFLKRRRRVKAWRAREEDLEDGVLGESLELRLSAPA